MQEPTIAEPTEQEFKKRFPEVEKLEAPTTRLHLCSDGKHRNDEQYEIYKKYEERLELKKAQFKKEPDQFIHIDDVVMAVIQGDKGRGVVFGRYSIEDCKSALVTLQHRFFNAMTEFEYKMQLDQAKKDGLVGPDGKPLAQKPSSGIIS